MFLNSVQSFMIDNCDGRPIENGLNNVCLYPLFRTFSSISFSLKGKIGADLSPGKAVLDQDFMFLLYKQVHGLSRSNGFHV